MSLSGADSAWGKRWRHISRRTRTVVVVVVVLAIVRMCLPFAVESYVNRQLNRASDYGGRIGHVDIQLYRGQYRIHDIQIVKRSGGGDVPFFTARRLDLSIEWRELFHGSVVGQVTMIQPQLNFEETQTGQNESWDQILGSLFPFKLNRLEVTGGQIHFRNPGSNPPVDIFLRDLAVTATNLSNSRSLKGTLPAGVEIHGSTVGGGGLTLNLHLNPVEKAPTYEVTAELTNVALTSLNSFLKAYGKFDVDDGIFALYASVAAKDGNYDGYLKVFFQRLKVFRWEKERRKDALEIFWQAIVGTTATILKNHFEDQLATKVPISGSYQGGTVGVWTAIGTLLRNAFIRALVPVMDQPVTLQQVDQKVYQSQHYESKTNTTPEKGSDELIKH
jgi:Domain of Unknown Function (DUF748)